MDSIGFYVWLLPVIFMIHELEEIFLAEAWYIRSKEKIHALWPKRIPFGMNRVEHYPSAAIGFGIFIEYLEFILICVLCVVFNNYLAWFGLFISFLFHMFTPHLADVIKLKAYEPGIISSAVLLIPSIW
ncbi:MAG: HXXEE domain-containing protein, partial [Anaerolineaceae bacterium]